MTCHYDEYSGRYSECDGSQRCMCPEQMTAAELVHLVRSMLLTRAGEVITPELADERARNIAAVLVVEMGVWS